MKLTQKIRINPSKKQEHLLWKLSEKCRLIYNFALAERIEIYQQNKRTSKEKRHYITYSSQSRALPILKEKYPE
ncbi:MAG: helix-turn-helix domain-containing protein, partial [Candidatus Lokiarchaeota archaeon]|nr:helix-turn-helix domain-containing protein [Candidatus Lokiarchaeota archaeon]